MPDPTLNALLRRLERWELGHLRRLAAELSSRVNRLEEDLDRTRCEAARAWEAADAWQRDAERLAAELQAFGGQVRMNERGELSAHHDELN